jgi:hypothetical protein
MLIIFPMRFKYSPVTVCRHWKRTMWTETEHCPIRNSWPDADEERPSSRFFLAGSRRGETVLYRFFLAGSRREETEFMEGRRQGETDLKNVRVGAGTQRDSPLKSS